MIKKDKQIFDLSGGSAALRLYVKKLFFIFTLLILFSVCAFAQNNSDQKPETQTLPVNFKSDGCSLFPDGDYCDCCVEHDKKYYFGGSFRERRQADISLYKCVRRKKGFHHKIIAPLMYLGVRIGGVSWLPTPFRWGFGNTKKNKIRNNSQPAKIENKTT